MVFQVWKMFRRDLQSVQYGKFIIFVPRGRHHLLVQGHRGQFVNDIRRLQARDRVGFRPGAIGDGLGGLPRRGVRGRGVHLRQERQWRARGRQEPGARRRDQWHGDRKAWQFINDCQAFIFIPKLLLAVVAVGKFSFVGTLEESLVVVVTKLEVNRVDLVILICDPHQIDIGGIDRLPVKCVPCSQGRSLR